MSGALRKHVKLRIREAERFAVSVMSQLRLADGSHIDALICNLSSRGFMINSAEYFPTGSVLDVVVPGIGSRSARVIWSFCGDTGARFLEPIDMHLYWGATRVPELADMEPLSPTEHLGKWYKRSVERINAEGSFALRAESFYTVDAQILDISSLVLKGMCPQPLTIGSIVEIDIPGLGSIEAEVKWELRGQFGAMFREPIDLRHCEWTCARNGSD